MHYLTRVASLASAVAGLAAVHSCLGAVGPLQAFGTPEQKAAWLSQLASGKKLSAFALTEPHAGTDVTALQMQAEREGDFFYLTGEKRFISNLLPGRLVAVVCMLEKQPAVLLVDLPEQENAQFQMLRHELHTLKHLYNYGLRLQRFPVPVKNLLPAPQGNGLQIAYHGLNRGRVAVCANAAGSMRRMLCSLIDWCHYRETYGAALAEREIVRHRLARLAALITGADALSSWAAGVLQQGERGELECMVAKIFASGALQEAAIDIALRTHGGRAFLVGHMLGDKLHDYLAPNIYEGEGDMLSLAFMRTLVKQLTATAGVKQASQLIVSNYAPLQKCVEQAAIGLQAMQQEIAQAIQTHGKALEQQQGCVLFLSQRVQKWVTMLVTCFYAVDKPPIVQQAAVLLAEELYRELTGTFPSDASFAAANALGEQIASGSFPLLEANTPPPILLPYK